MTLQQLRAVCEIVANNYNISRAAIALHASQPAVSKMLASLERELGAGIFVRTKGRLTGLTEFGGNVCLLARRMLHDATSLADMAADCFSQESGHLRIAATHLHARYAVLKAVKSFARAYPNVGVEITQANPAVVVELVAAGETQLGVTTLPNAIPDQVLTLPAHKVERCVITPFAHPLLELKKIGLHEIVKYPMVAYDHAFVSGRAVQEVFERQGLRPRIVLKATGADVVKAAVVAGLGIAIFQTMAVDPEEDKGLAIIEARHLFPSSQAHIILRRGQYLRRFTYDFIARLAPEWTQKKIEARLSAR